MAVQRSKEYETLTDWVRDKASIITYPIGRFLGQLGIHPNTITILGFILNVITGAVLATGEHLWGGILVMVASSVDGLDGALARVTGKKSQFGAFLDSTLDRLSEAALFFGLLMWFVSQGMRIETYLVYFVVLGSVMVSYTRARAEGLQIDCKVGILTRLERMAILCLGLLLGWLRPTLIIMCVLTWITFAQRMVAVYHRTRDRDSLENNRT
jgi:CDP-diacylglycerol--glycerol-3-phosphate 3-phosphatidyltransferase